MAVNNLNNYTAADGLGFPLNFRRGNPNPLDNSSVWSTLVAAQNYAATDPVAYVGQILTVVENDEVVAYVITNEAGDLEQVGKELLLDEGALVFKEDGTLSLKGFEAAELNAQLTKTASGVSWIKPDTTTVEGLGTSVEGLQTSVGELENDVTRIDKDIEALETTQGTLTEAVDDLENRVDVLTNPDATVEGSVLKIVNDAIAGVVAGADADFDTLKEIADWIAAHPESVAELNSKIAANTAAIEKNAGDISTNADAIAALEASLGEGGATAAAIAAVDAKADGIAADLETLETGAVKNNTDAITLLNGDAATQGSVDYKIKQHADAAASTYATIDNLKLATDRITANEGHIATINGNITDLQGAVATKAEQTAVDALDGRLDILEAIDHFDPENRSLLASITQGNVDAWSAAQPNVIESVKVNNVALAISDKTVNIELPTGTADVLGMVKVDNDTIEANNGTIGVKAIEVSKLYVGEGNELILNGGGAAL